MLTKQQPHQSRKPSDDELRQELQKHGFPNLPITETTRNILIKKLKQCQAPPRSRSNSRGRSNQQGQTASGRSGVGSSPYRQQQQQQQQQQQLSNGGVSNTYHQTRRSLANGGHTSTMSPTSTTQQSQSPRQVCGTSQDMPSNWFSRMERGYDEVNSSSSSSSGSGHNKSHQHMALRTQSNSPRRSKIHVPPPIIATETPSQGQQQSSSSYDWDLSGGEKASNGGGGSGSKSDSESPPQVVSRLLKLRDINLRRPPVSSISTNLMNSYMQTDSDSDSGGGGGGGASPSSSLPSSMSTTAQRYIMMANTGGAAASNSATATLNHYRSSSSSTGVLGNGHHQQPSSYVGGYHHHHHHHQPHQQPHHHYQHQHHSPPSYLYHHPSHYPSRHDRGVASSSSSASTTQKQLQFLNLKHKFQQSSIPFFLMSAMGLFFGVLALLYLNKPPDISSTMTEKSTTFVLCDTFRLRDFQLQQQQQQEQQEQEQEKQVNEAWKSLDFERAIQKETTDEESEEAARSFDLESIREKEKKEEEEESVTLEPFEELRRRVGHDHERLDEEQQRREDGEEEEDGETNMMMLEVITMQPSVNCIEKDLLTNAIHLNRELMKLLQRNTEAHYCHNPEIPPTINGRELIKYLHQKLLFVSKMNGHNLLRHLQASLYLIEKNPQWKIVVVNNKSRLNDDDDGDNDEGGGAEGESSSTRMKLRRRQRQRPEQPLDKETILNLEFGLVKPYLPLQCVLRHKMQRFIYIIGSVFMLTVLSLLLYAAIQFVRRRRHLHQLQVDNFTLAIVKELMVQAVNYHQQQQQQQQQQLNANKSLPQNEISINDSSGGFVGVGGGGVGGGEVIINHLRDKLLTINRRRSHLKAWNDALQRLETNDSRIHFDTILKNGELFRTMKWIETPCPSVSPVSSSSGSSPSPSSPLHSQGGAGVNGGIHNNISQQQQQQQPLSPTSMVGGGGGVGLSAPPPPPVRRGRKKEWQSPAFDNVNNTFEPPTPCLKIRHMFDSSEVHQTDLKQTIILAILEKVGPLCRINDIQLDLQSCCVYIRCASEADAGIVHREINGWWFDNHLVSIKFLRLQRYLARFPSTKRNGSASPPLSSNIGS